MSEQGSIKGTGSSEEKKQPTRAELLQQELEQLRKEFSDFKKASESKDKSANTDLAQAIRDLAGVSDGKPRIANDMQKGDFDSEDYDEVGKTYFAYMFTRVLTTTKVGGRTYPEPPFGAIILQYQSSLPAPGSGRENNYIQLSAYTSHSKKEQAWIEGHPDFKAGIVTIRLSTKLSLDDVHKANKRSRFASVAATWTPTEVARHAHQYGVDIVDDVDYMRNKIVDKLIEAEDKRAEETSRRIVAESSKEKYLESAAPGA